MHCLIKPIWFVLPDGDKHLINPPSADAFDAALEIETAPDAESMRDRRRRLRTQAELLCGLRNPELPDYPLYQPEERSWIGKAPVYAIGQIITACVALAEGINPEDAVAMDDWLKKKAISELILSKLADPSVA